MHLLFSVTSGGSRQRQPRPRRPRRAPRAATDLPAGRRVPFVETRLPMVAVVELRPGCCCSRRGTRPRSRRRPGTLPTRPGRRRHQAPPVAREPGHDRRRPRFRPAVGISPARKMRPSGPSSSSRHRPTRRRVTFEPPPVSLMCVQAAASARPPPAAASLLFSSYPTAHGELPSSVVHTSRPRRPVSIVAEENARAADRRSDGCMWPSPCMAWCSRNLTPVGTYFWAGPWPNPADLAVWSSPF